MAAIPSNSYPTFDEHQWVLHIRTTIEEELDYDIEIPVSIFNVPKLLINTDPHSYTPQILAIGPYHYWRPELHEMERYKLAAARRNQKQLCHVKFQHVVEQLIKLDLKIRACYHKFLDLSRDTLAWMMALDGSFLLEFLQIYAIQEGKSITRVASRMSHLVDYAGRKSAHNAILRDMVMLENQIPLFVLRKLLEFQFSSLESSDQMLDSMILGFCKEVSPLKFIEGTKNIPVSEFSHLLDYLYRMLVPKIGEPQAEITEPDDEEEGNKMITKEESEAANSSHVKECLSMIWNILSKMNKGSVQLIKQFLTSRFLKFFLQLPWTILSKLPGFSLLLQPVQILLFSDNNKEETKPENDSSHIDANKPPLVEEITIPSVTELFKSGVRFQATTGDISSIGFDPKTVTFYLPMVSLDVNTEVVLRNLVAYEASSASGPLVLTRYTEMMNGIVDSEEDVKLLREKGIIVNRLKKDGEAADVWNGMNKSIRLTKVGFLDKVIEDVNKYYSGRWRVKMGKFMKDYVFGSWQFLTLLAATMLLVLMTLQSFCTVYVCAPLFRITTAA